MAKGETNVMRCFLGLSVPQDIRETLAAQCHAWRQAGLEGAWVKPENYHVTVRFLGNVTEEQRTRLDATLEPALAACAPLRLRVAGMGAFPNPRRPRVVWAGLEILEGAFEPVAREVEAGARAMGLPPETKAVTPHITLLRFRRPPDGDVLKRCIDAEMASPGDFIAGGVALWRSKLLPGGAEYQLLREYKFS